MMTSNYHTKYLVEDHWLAQVGILDRFCKHGKIDEEPSHHSSSHKEKSTKYKCYKNHIKPGDDNKKSLSAKLP